MAPREDRPYFPWYFKDWLTSPDRFSMSYEQRGIYRDLLDFAWDQRGLSTDLEHVRAMLGLDKRRFQLAWDKLKVHFTERDGRLYNEKQERVRFDMDTFRESKREAGRRGGKTRAERQAVAKQNPSSATNLLEANPKPSSASAFASSLSETPKTASPPSAPLVMSPLAYQKALENNAFVGSRLKIPKKLHDDFRRSLGGSEPDARLQAWYAEVDEEIERTGEPIIPDIWKWMEARFKSWAINQAGDSEKAKFMEWAHGR
jgi:uncharacterized protein YdaU (DUF1376 family)